MKKRINLFSRQKRNDFFSVYGQRIRYVGTIAGIAFFLLFLFVMFSLLRVKQSILSVNDKKKLQLTYLLENKDLEANTRYFKGKQTQLTKYLEDDANFVPYYSVLSDALKSSSQSANLDRITIDKNRETTFVIQFTQYESMLSFLKYIETDDFLGSFDELSLANFSLSKRDTAGTVIENKNKYQLQFKGKFKQTDEKLFQ